MLGVDKSSVCAAAYAAASVFCMDLWLLVRNVCLYLAWTRNRKAKDQAMTTDLEQAHGTPLHATSYGITAQRGAGHHHHTAHLTATPGPTGTASTTTRGLSAMAAVADPATSLTPDNTTQALSDSLRAGLVLESMWYLIFGLSWSFMFGFVWLRNVHSSVLWLVIAVGASHVIMTITTCCNAATLTPPVPRPPGCRYRGSDGTYCYGGDGGGYGGGDGGGGGGCGGDGGGCG